MPGNFFKIAILKNGFFLFYFAENKYRFRLRCGVGWKFFPVLSENYVSDISGVLHYKSRAFKLLPD